MHDCERHNIIIQEKKHMDKRCMSPSQSQWAEEHLNLFHCIYNFLTRLLLFLIISKQRSVCSKQLTQPSELTLNLVKHSFIKSTVFFIAITYFTVFFCCFFNLWDKFTNLLRSLLIKTVQTVSLRIWQYFSSLFRVKCASCTVSFKSVKWGTTLGTFLGYK